MKKKIEDKANLSDKNVRLIVEKVKNLNKVAQNATQWKIFVIGHCDMKKVMNLYFECGSTQNIHKKKKKNYSGLQISDEEEESIARRVRREC